MRKFTRLMVGIDVTIIMGLSLVLLCWGILCEMQMVMPREIVKAAVGEAASDPSIRMAIEVTAGALLLLHLVWMERVVRLARRGNVIELEKPDGTLVIAVSAVEDSLERVVKQQSGVRDVRVRMRVPEMPTLPVEVVLVASILDSEGILAVEDRMRQAIRRRFEEILPHLDLRVSVRLRRFVAGDGKPREEAGRVYRGPEYPLEGY